MKKIFFISSLLFLNIAAASYATPFLNSSGVIANSVSINGVQYSVYDLHWADDDWNASKSGYTFDLTAATGGYYKYSGYYLGTFDGKGVDGNLKEINLENLASYYLGASFDETFTKSDDPGTILSVTYFTSDKDNGTWITVSASETLVASFYGVKSSSYFALYLLDPAVAFGYWSTIHVPTNGDTAPTLSHLGVDGVVTSHSVPEPTTIFLFGTGLIGLAGIARRKKN